MKKDLGIIKWIKDRNLKTNKGTRIEFENYPFMWDYLTDPHNRIVLQKCTQIGATFSTILKILYLGDKSNISIIFTLPTSGDVKDFVLSKFDPVIRSSSSLQAKVTKDPLSRRAIFSTVLKRIGGSHYFFRGSWSAHFAQSIDADVLVVDELDFQKPDIRKMYEERLEGARSKDVIYWLGTPTFPRQGISDLYERSDKRVWHIRCPHCKRLQSLDWPDSISKRKKSFICKFCRKDLPRQARMKGVWIAQNPGRPIHGYYVNRLMAPWASAEKILKDYREKSTRHFYNFTLGLPYLERSRQLSRDEFRSNLVTREQLQALGKAKVICGIDQGNNFHVVMGCASSQGTVVTKLDRLMNSDQLEDFLSSYRPEFMAMDMFPDQHYAKKLQKQYGRDRFFLVNQRTWQDAQKVHEIQEFDRSRGLINLERTEALDRLYDRIRSGSLGILESIAGIDDLFTHLQNLIPDVQKKFGRERKVYRKIGQDDFTHALNYFLTASLLAFPNIDTQATQIVPSVTPAPEHLKGSKAWLQENLERQFQKLAGSSGTIIIKPKKL